MILVLMFWKETRRLRLNTSSSENPWERRRSVSAGLQLSGDRVTLTAKSAMQRSRGVSGALV